jgi:hypothetical protein
MTDFVAKPIVKEALFAAIERSLASRLLDRAA